MTRTHLVVVTVVVYIVACSVTRAASAKQAELTNRIEKLVTKHFPDAVASQDNGTFSIKHGTMVFTIHRHLKTGEIRKEADQVEGPNFKGFMISISVHDGKYAGQAAIPQTLNERYWKTYIDRPSTKDGKGYFVINFSYGSSLDIAFKKAVFEALPKSPTPPKPLKANK